MFTDAQLLQLSITLVLAVILFIIAYSLPPKVSGIALLILIPFQPIDTKYASANVALVFVLFIALLIKGVRVKVPMLPQIGALLFIYMVSLGISHPPTLGQHGVYVFALVSAFLMLWIAYDVSMRVDGMRDVVNFLLIMNIFIVIYSFIQIIAGPGERVVLFGINELHMMRVRADRRLTGPFGAAGIMAEYLVIILFFILYQFLTSRDFWARIGLALLAATNLMLLVTTGNRGGFLVLIGAGLMFLWLFRKVLGPVRTMGIAAAAIVVLAISSLVAINLTEFDRLYERLAKTEVDSGVPDTRAIVWPVAWEAITEKPILGHGPRLRFDGEEDGARYEGHLFILYPHNLYLFIMFTIGSVGLLAFLVFLMTPLVRCWKAARGSPVETYEVGLARTGIVVMTVILVDGIKIDFMRYNLVDYWHFIFALIGILIATCDRVAAQRASLQPQSIPTGQVQAVPT